MSDQRIRRNMTFGYFRQAQRKIAADVWILARQFGELGVGALAELTAMADVRKDQTQLREGGQRF